MSCDKMITGFVGVKVSQTIHSRLENELLRFVPTIVAPAHINLLMYVSNVVYSSS